MNNLDVNHNIRFLSWIYDEMRSQTEYLKNINSGVRIFVLVLLINIILTLLGGFGMY